VSLPKNGIFRKNSPKVLCGRALGEHMTSEVVGKTYDPAWGTYIGRSLAANEWSGAPLNYARGLIGSPPTYNDVLEPIGGSKKPPMVLISGQNVSAEYRSAHSARSYARLRGRSGPPAHRHRHFGKSRISVRHPPATRRRIRSYFLIHELLMGMR
jgi:hypothetical protein